MRDLIERLKEAAKQMQIGVHSPGHIAAIEEAIRELAKKDAQRNDAEPEQAITYKLFIRYALSGLIVDHLACKSKDDLYRYVGKLFLGSIERIDRIDFKEEK